VPDFAAWMIALFMAWLFANAVTHKLRHRAYYCQLIGSWIGAERAALPAWLMVVIAELLTVLLLLMPSLQSLGFGLASILLALYAGVMLVQLANGRTDSRCGCAGPDHDLHVSAELIARNLICVGLVMLALLPQQAIEVSWVLKNSITLLGGSFLILMYVLSEQLVANRQQMRGHR